MNFTQDMRQYGETAVEQGKAVAAEARKPLYALVGAGELAVERARDLAGKVRQADQDAVRDRVSQVTKYLQETGAQARTAYAGLSERGERVLIGLRQQPVLHKVLVGAEEAVDKVEDALEDLIARGETKMADADAGKMGDEAPSMADDISEADAAELADEITPDAKSDTKSDAGSGTGSGTESDAESDGAHTESATSDRSGTASAKSAKSAARSGSRSGRKAAPDA